MSDLDVIAPAARVVQLGERQVEILPLKVRQLPGVMRAIKPILSDLAQGTDSDGLMAIYVEHAEAVNAAIAIMANMAPADVEELDIGDGLAILAAVLEVNRDFFTRRLPELVAMATRGAGPTP